MEVDILVSSEGKSTLFPGIVDCFYSDIAWWLCHFFYFSGEGDEKKRPVIIHRAILGSVERMIAILTENFGGKW